MSAERIDSDLELNYSRALLFLQLAIEQLRVVDPTASHELRSFYHERISYIFAHHIKSDKYQSLAGICRSEARDLLPLSQDFYNDVVKRLAPSYPGLVDRTLLGSKFQAQTDKTIPFGTAARLGSPDQVNALAPNQNCLASADMCLITTKSSTEFGAVGQGKPTSHIEAIVPIDCDRRQSRSRADFNTAMNDLVHVTSPAMSVLEDTTNIRPNQPGNSKAVSSSVSNDWNWEHYPGSTHMRFSNMTLNHENLEHDRIVASPLLNTDSPSLSNNLAQIQDWKLPIHSSCTLKGYEIFSQNDQQDLITDDADSFLTIQTRNQGVKANRPNGTWARVAALTDGTHPVTRLDSKFNLVQAPRAAQALPVAGQAQSATKCAPVSRLSYGFDRDGKETFEGQLRVVWLLNLPTSYTALQVSRNITSGPLFSLSLEKDVAEHLPGLSACIIFQFSTHAKEFLLSNECSVTFQECADNEQFPTPETSQNKGLRNKYQSDAHNAVLQLGNPYPVSSHANIFAKMLPPHMARRRVKWARARLFHSVPITTFKRDILRLVGSHELIELWHFYNPGECTVVFASVAVAIKVVDAFKHWATGKTKAFSKKCSNETEKIKADGRYAGIEVAFCKDFNETPAGRLVSSYGLGNTASTAIPGYEGLFEGPKVKVNPL